MDPTHVNTRARKQADRPVSRNQVTVRKGVPAQRDALPPRRENIEPVHPPPAAHVPPSQSIRNRRGMPNAFSFVAPIARRFEGPTKVPNVPPKPPWDPRNLNGETRKYRARPPQLDFPGPQSAASAPRMMVSSASSRKRLAARKRFVDDESDHDPDFAILLPWDLRSHNRADDRDDSSEETDDSDDPVFQSAPRSVGKAARKNNLTQTAMKRAFTSAGVPAVRAARKNVRSVSDSSTSSEEGDNNVQHLLNALEHISLTTYRLREYHRLPFLMRNLRAGFRLRCEMASILTKPANPPVAPVTVIFKYHVPVESSSSDEAMTRGEKHEVQERTVSMHEWTCPLCQLYGPFNTREMLAFHLRCGHDEVQVSWTVMSHEMWRIALTIPSYDDEHDVENDEDDTDESTSQPDNQPPTPPLNPDSIADDFNAMSVDSLDAVPPVASEARISPAPPVILHKFRQYSPTPPSSSLFLVTDDRESTPTPPTVHKFRQYSPTPSSSASTLQSAPIFSRSNTARDPSRVASTPATSHSGTTSRVSATPSSSRMSVMPGTVRSSSTVTTDTLSTDTRSQTLEAQPRYPTPPPPNDPFGPAAQHPYLPPVREGNREVYYSCRPGGPRVYDLLNMLPLEQFGVLAWWVIDREEELFELDDMRDEDKVMLALWNRWIILHRVEFVFNHHGYLKSVLAFVDEYWLTIHRAAGWSALRAFLLMLMADRFLDAAEVVKVLKHYEKHTGMDSWHKVISASNAE